MVIAGPNGAGKSTLLNALRSQPGSGPILYVGPHRNARRQFVQWRHLLTAPISLEQLLSQQNTPNFEGISLLTGQRDAWGFDDVANYLKHGLCQIELDRKDAIAARYDREGEIGKNTLPDPWAPLRELSSNLLPHLSFERIDASDRNQVRVLWRVHANDIIVDLDDLSSGEKSVVQIFYPLIEARIRAILRQIQNVETSQAHPEMCVLIDEPELHLHPNLQVKVFDYLRLLTEGGRLQVIVATHSPTIVEYASFEELFLLRPVETIASGDNQLVQVANDEERLNFLRTVFGTTSNLTAMQAVVVVEGIEQTSASRTVSDRKLYRALHPGFDRITLISGGGKSDCIRLRALLDGTLRQFSSSLPTVALLDRDLSDVDPPEGTVFLPVSMIENFLLDPHAIWEAIQSVIEKTGFGSVEDVASALDRILDKMTESEVARRVVDKIGKHVFQPRPPVSEIPQQAAAFAAELAIATSEQNVKDLQAAAEASIGELRSSQARREYFHGKQVLREFQKKHLHSTGMAETIFRYETARNARSRKSVVDFFNTFFEEALPQIKAPRLRT